MVVKYLAVISALLFPFMAAAQSDGFYTDTEKGDWFSAHHSGDSGIHTDLCLLSNNEGTFAIRADSKNIQLITINDQWNLPADTSGDLWITDGTYGETFTMGSLGPKQLRGEVTPLSVIDIVKTMNRSSNLSMLFGEKTRLTISLNGAGVAANAFLDCIQTAQLVKIPSDSISAKTPF
ncbi:hypothetical protein AD940_01870 [Gluconobacter thailandicus]|uniref:hypothetical protein n=1 Tax=Gluconobacter thailandicus TaxID=257438 RepID=UPI000777271D|nr:hypothetical protein [Gluconobacter thailandicus]KXV35720.1 hypothetical protein AD940_01870 [Gluconobacter thailandicus]